MRKIRTKKMFFETFWTNSSGGFGGSETLCNKKFFTSSLFSSLSSCLVLSFVFSVVLSFSWSLDLLFRLVFFLCLSLCLRVMLSCVVVLCCVWECMWCLWCRCGQIPLSSWNEQQPRTERLVMGARSSNYSEWNIDEKWSSQEWKSGEILEARTERPVGGQQHVHSWTGWMIDCERYWTILQKMQCKTSTNVL